MRITIATGPLLPVPAVRGGSVPRMWMGIAEALARRGHAVVVVARSHPGQAERERSEGVDYLRFGGYDQGRGIALELARDLAYSLPAALRLPPADILVTNNFWMPVAAGFLARRAGRIVVNANRHPKGQYFLYRRAAAIAAASQAVAGAVARECPTLAPRTVVIPNTVDRAFLAQGARGGAAEGKRTLLYVGRLHPEKGVHLLLDAFAGLSARHREWRLVILGPDEAASGGGGAAYARRLRETARGLDVEFRAPVYDPEALAQAYRQADLFCYPTLADRGEALPVAPLEAMACGLPVVASALECMKEIVTEGETGWTFDWRGPQAAAALQRALGTAMGDPHALAAAGERARSFAQGFGCEAVAGRYEALFRSLVAGGPVDA